MIGRRFQIEGVAHSNLAGCPTLSLEAAYDEDVVVTGCRNKAMLRFPQANKVCLHRGFLFFVFRMN